MGMVHHLYLLCLCRKILIIRRRVKMKKKILVVDDEIHIVQIVKFNLEKRGGYEVITAKNGEED